ncbi:hypothetical protein FB639_005453, partial [Coemansia asiatica]
MAGSTSTTATNRGSARAEPEKAVLNGVSASASATSAAGDFASAVVSAVANSSGTSLGNGRRVASTGLAPSLDSKLGMQMQPMEEATGVDENIPLSTLFNTRSMNEADILPPSILQSMNFWMNDSLLTGATTAAASISAGSSAIPAQAPVAMDIAQTMASAGLDGSQFSSISQAAFQQPQRQLSQQSQQSRVQELDILSNLIPMDIALGLPAFTST